MCFLVLTTSLTINYLTLLSLLGGGPMFGQGGEQAPRLNTKLIQQPPPWHNMHMNGGHMHLPPVPPQSINIEMGSQRGGNYPLPPPITESCIQNNFTFPSAHPMNTYNENVLVRYCAGNNFMAEEEVGREEGMEKRPTEETESGLSSSESIYDNDNKRRMEEAKQRKAGGGSDAEESEAEDDEEDVFEKGDDKIIYRYTDEGARLLSS